MAEITFGVYDLFNPSPVSLKQLSVIVVSLEVWRREINKYRSSRSLKKFCPSGASISSKTIIPNLPSAIYSTIDYYVKKLGHSMSRWLQSHHDEIFCYHYNRDTRVLEYFEDFVCDYDGTIHYARTAQRTMNCDRFNVNQKFLIACTYCFEDDIRRIWPALGLKKTDSLYERYSKNLRFAYWINFLENYIKITEPPIEELMFDEFMSRNRTSLEYFWNLIPLENRLRKAIDLYIDDYSSFVRFILPKLDGQQLNEFLYENGCDFLYTMLKNSCFNEDVVLSTWSYVKNSMNEIAFTNLIVKMIQSEVTGVYLSSELDDEYYNWMMEEYVIDNRVPDNFLQLCFEIWDTAAEDLKRWAVADIASNNTLFEVIFNVDVPLPTSREFKFLLAVLSYATYEQRNAFWHNCWRYLIHKTRVEDLDKIMRLCLRDEDEITQFKKNMANDINVIDVCSTLLTAAYFDELNKFLRFLLPEMQATRNFKQRLLRCTFLNDAFCNLNAEIVKKPKEFNEFINDAYDDVDQSADFKNTLMSSPLVQKCFAVYAVVVPIEHLTEFIDTFVSNERILLEVKTHVIDFLKKDAADFKNDLPKSSFTSLLSWCLEGNEEFSKFELSYL
ncbi:uncharacterized protein LOC135846369 isoform X1 [Planococcus citri]|uniref:uncharacterized protein LOC135846369 isoform X1 n=1 Tax=Planococcus citri TaxID=170843 RepID=UPI0031FA088D